MNLTKLTYKVFTLILLLISFNVNSQNCNGETFNSPGAPSTCTYTYSTSGWDTTPPNNINDGDSVCILVDNNTDFGTFKGDLYIAEGITYSGTLGSINSSTTIVVAGTASFGGEPPVAGTIYIEETGTYNAIDTNFSPTGIIYNAGILNASNDISLGGSATLYNFNNATINVTGDITISKPFQNCGLLEVYGDLSTTGSGGLNNACSTWIHGDMNLNSDYYSNSLIVLEGTLNFNGADFYNNDILMVDNINLSGDHLIGNNETSTLIVKYNSTLTSGGSITGHYYFDMDNGGGVDSVCGTCTADIDIVNVDVPNVVEEMIADCGNNIVIEPPVTESTLDFDGIDDYAEQLNSTINGLDQYTISFWFKYEGDMITNSDKVFLMGQKGVFEAYIGDWSDTENVNQTIGAYLFKSDGLKQGSGWRFDRTSWTHLTVTVDNTGTGTEFRVFRNGYGTSGSTIASSTTSNSNPFRIAIPNGSSSYKNFKGWIDELRVFDSILTDDQIQQLVYQEIEDNNGNVRGTVVPKDIEDFTSGSEILWSNLQAYYPMTKIISDTRTDDYSKNSNPLKLFNIDTFQPQTAPMPYETVSDGDWNNKTTWLHGDIWDIESLDSEFGSSDQNPEQWSIVKVHHDVTSNTSRRNLGLFIDDEKTLTINGDNSVTNNWYLELNGALNLADDSQLVQTINSDLVTDTNGKILRGQKGTSNIYWYNYWSSPVGNSSLTPLNNNNTTSNNSGNKPFNLDMLKDGNELEIGFTSSYAEAGKLSRTWFYTFQNGTTYWNWNSFTETTPINPGVGYIHKGTGNTGTEQKYIFEGKPNNGTILVNVTDVGGDGSVPTVSKTDYLLGNPYPSALDIHKFIDDNDKVIGGKLLLWEQWSGSSHYLNEYDGGYATVNKSGGVKAYQFVGLDGENNGSLDGTKTPTRYLPVGQGFIAEIIADGDVVFNNSQRVFVKEADADGTYDNGSVFFRNSNTSSGTKTNEMRTIKLQFNANGGPSRELLLGFSHSTSDDYDYGYDAINPDDLHEDDLNLSFGKDKMTIQAYSQINSEKSVPLLFKASGNYTYEIGASEIYNIAEEQEIYLRDNLTGAYFDLRNDQAYSFTSNPGEFNDRFDVVFQSADTLSNEDFVNDVNLIYVNNIEDMLYAKGLSTQVKQVKIINMIGQTVKTYSNINNQDLENGINLSNLNSGVYIVNINTESSTQISKKIILD